MIQEEINRLVKHLPGNKIGFLGYVWQAESIRPNYDFNSLRHPKIFECLEYILGVELFFYCFEPPTAERSSKEFNLYIRIVEACAKMVVDNGAKTPPKPEPVEGYTRRDREREFSEFDYIACRIYDDIVKDIHVGVLPAGKDDTIPRGAFLEWLDKYIKSPQGIDTVDYSNLPQEEKLGAIRRWKAPGPQHRTNNEISLCIFPDKAISLENLKKNKRLAGSLTRTINRWIE